MSKLPKAPLVEVVFELRWKIINKADLSKIPYLYGDIYAQLKNKYPFRESIVPPEIPIDILINQPVHRFRTAPNEYPLFQVGPGLITLNTIDSKYYWETFLKDAEELISSFLETFPLQESDKLNPSILFIDFFSFDFEKNDVHKFINENFKINFSQSFIKATKNPNDINLGFYYEIPLGNLSVIFNKGKNTNQTEGIVMQTRINGISVNPKIEDLLLWLQQSHETCSEIFKSLTEGKLYESFKS